MAGLRKRAGLTGGQALAPTLLLPLLLPLLMAFALYEKTRRTPVTLAGYVPAQRAPVLRNPF